MTLEERADHVGAELDIGGIIGVEDKACQVGPLFGERVRDPIGGSFAGVARTDVVYEG